MKKNLERGGALLLAVCMLLQTFIYVPKASAAAQASAANSFALKDVNVAQKQTLTDNGNGNYTLSITLDAGLNHTDANTESGVSQNNYFTAQYAGYYLVELWGGTGGDGDDTNICDGGTGGKGGHVYGKVFLNKGETLYYQLGGDGVPTSAVDAGGGANGEGGGHGDIGSMKVGGGGGYSALYKFAPAEFEQKYTDGNGNLTKEISEADRTSKYILIAGGGGGGGAGDGWSILGDDPVGTADGGAGGSMSSASGQLIGAGYAVEGTYYVGGEGKSSGRDTSYVGHGGSNVPGAVSDTWTTLIKGKQPNDWEGALNPDMAGGSGGSGNMRGGAGGAGYCGGSGAVMTTIVSNYNIGGGGGGSSFVASSIAALTAEEQSLLISDPDELSTTGGAVQIAFLGGDEFTYIENLTLEVDLSQYMTLSSATTSSGTWSGTTLTGMNLVEAPATVELKLKAANGFAGGNNVPLFDEGITCSTTEATPTSAQLQLGDACSYVNVPIIGVKVDVKNHTTNDNTIEHPVDSLHGDLYDSWTPPAGEEWKYDFIKSIVGYTVDAPDAYTSEGVLVVKPSVSTEYPVSVVVTPKTDGGYAAVGERVTATPVTENSLITILDGGTDVLNGNAIKYYKELSHDGENYILTLHTDITSNLTENIAASTYTSGTGTYVAPATGYYYIQTWGGKGRDGGGTWGYDGGTGGAGGYISGYVYLKKDASLNITVGSAGDVANSGLLWGSNGAGGGYSMVQQAADSNYLLIAAGGNGGGNGTVGTGDGANGTAGFINANAAGNGASTTILANLTDYNGIAGNNVEKNGVPTADNYYSSSIINQKGAGAGLTASVTGFGTTKPTSAGANGAVVITPLQLENPEQAELVDYTITTELSDYFVLADTVENATSFGDGNGSEEGGGVYTSGEGHIIGYNYQDISTGKNLITISNIDPVVTRTEKTEILNEVEVTRTTKTASFMISFRLIPRYGFLGGNDVPVLKKQQTEHGMSMTYNQLSASMPILADPKVDNANVEIPADNSWTQAEFTVTDHTITAGMTVACSELYELSAGAPSFDYTEGAWKTDAAWENDFVQPKIQLTNTLTGEVVEGDTLAPAQTTPYIVSVGLAPLPPTVDDPQDAICIPPVDGTMQEKQVIIYVLPRIIYQLTNLETSDTNGIWIDDEYTVTVEADKAYTAKLSPKDGYQLPDKNDSANFSVWKNGMVVTEGYTYDSSTGMITLGADLVGTNAIIIRASGGEAQYTITYGYEKAPGVPHNPVVDGPYPSYTAPEGTPIPNTVFHKTYSPNMSFPNSQHYDFIWTWEVEGGAEPTVMPAQDIWAVGQYVPNEYTLVVQYLEEGTNTVLAAENTETKVRYGKDYEVYPVDVTGYKPTATVISGTMVDDTDGTITDGKKTVTFYYEPIAGKLDITYIYGDTHETISTVSQDIKFGDTYSVTSPAIPGYTPDKAVVSGTVSAEDATNGISVTVTYQPNIYTVTFDPNGGTVGESSREVVFNRTYDYHRYYDAEKADYAFAYNALPKPVRSSTAGTSYEFQGWYLDGVQITDSSQVTTDGDHTLVAQWKEATLEYVLTIKYIYEDGTAVMEEKNGQLVAKVHTEKVPYGGTYTVDSPDLPGYTPDIDPVTGTMGGTNKVVYVTYISDTHTLTIHYVFADGGGTAAPDYSAEILKGASYTVVSPAVTKDDVAYKPSVDTVTGTMGEEDIVVTVYYTKTGPVVSVTVTWGELDFVYDYGTWQPETHTYSQEPIQPATISKNFVTVTNNAESNIPINAKLSYEVDNDFDVYADIDGYFTTTDNRAGMLTDETGTLQPTEFRTRYFWLQGTMERGQTGTLTSGTCTVTITGGG